MNKYLLMLIAGIFLYSCKKEKNDPAVPGTLTVTELNDVTVSHGNAVSVDLNKDGRQDITFATWMIGDPLEMEDELLFFAQSGTESLLMTNSENNSPRFEAGEFIPNTNFGDGEWWVVSMAELARKNIPLTGSPYWELAWADAIHQFLAVQVEKNGLVYTGWVELSMDKPRSRLILHRAAINTVANRGLKAGLVQ